MKKPNLSAKRIEIDKKNASLIVIVSVAVFVTIFCIVAIRALYGQLTYQSKVIREKEITLKQIELNIEEVSKLNTAYQEFSGTTTNILGGDPKGKADRDGENARIILDALPSKYDFPALTSSLDKLVKSGGFIATAIEGTDDEVNQAANQTAVTPSEIEMAFSLESSINSSDGKKFMELFERSIRPIHVQRLVVTAEESHIKLSVTAKTFYQPEKKLNVTEKVVK